MFFFGRSSIHLVATQTRGFAKIVRASVELKDVRSNDPVQMLNVFRKKCRGQEIHNLVRARRRHKKPTQAKRELKLR